MSLRQLLNVAHAHLVRGLPEAKRLEIDAQLAEKFTFEMNAQELRAHEYRKKAAELGIDLSAQQGLMNAFNLRPAGAV